MFSFAAAYTEYHGTLNDIPNGRGRRFEGTLDILHNGDVSLNEIYLRVQSGDVFQHLLRLLVRIATAGHNNQVFGTVSGHVDCQTPAQYFQAADDEVRDVLLKQEFAMRRSDLKNPSVSLSVSEKEVNSSLGHEFWHLGHLILQSSRCGCHPSCNGKRPVVFEREYLHRYNRFNMVLHNQVKNLAQKPIRLISKLNSMI